MLEAAMPGLFLLLSFIGLVRPVPGDVYFTMPEPTTKSLMITGLITLTFLTIFLRKKLG
jgi:uncharacterized membrane protein